MGEREFRGTRDSFSVTIKGDTVTDESSLVAQTKNRLSQINAGAANEITAKKRVFHIEGDTIVYPNMDGTKKMYLHFKDDETLVAWRSDWPGDPWEMHRVQSTPNP